MENKMKLLIISDIHGAVGQFEKLSAEFESCDMVLCAGDFASVNKREKANEDGDILSKPYPTLNAFLKTHTHLFAVSGNCDEDDLWQVLEDNDISVERLLVSSDGLLITGSGGALYFTGETAHERSEEDIKSDFTPLYDILENSAPNASESWDNLIIIAHHPPKDTKLDMISADIHVGSNEVRSVIERTQPLLVISGHIHESFAQDMLGHTFLINPGSLAEGRYACASIERREGIWHVSDIQLKKIES